MNDTRGSRAEVPLRASERPIGRRRSDRVVGSSAAIQDVLERAVAASASEVPGCISGPEGCGKEHIARAIHSWSAQANGPFVVVSCVGVPEPLRGREIFGCAESCYSSLPEAHEGAFQRARGGTLLIDLADSLASDLMQSLAKAMEVGHFQREGDASTLPLNTRVMFASREPLPPSHLRGLPHHTLTIPALRERSDDILPLAGHFLAIHAAENGIDPVGFSAEARSALSAESWPGNVRELSERIGQALRLAGNGAVSAEALMLAAPTDAVPSFKDAKRAFERRYVTGLLRRCGGNISRAARLAKKDRKDFYDVIRRTGVDPTEFR